MSEWKKGIAVCFGAADRKFAGHPYDQQKARDLRKLLKAEGIPDDEIELAFENWLAEKAPDSEHAKTEMEKVKKFFEL